MSAPETNTEKQAKRHRGPLIGIGLCLVFVVVLTAGWIILAGQEAEDPAGAAPDTNPQVMEGESGNGS